MRVASLVNDHVSSSICTGIKGKFATIYENSAWQISNLTTINFLRNAFGCEMKIMSYVKGNLTQPFPRRALMTIKFGSMQPRQSHFQGLLKFLQVLKPSPPS